MAVYNPKSLKAEEFINNEEILETLEYAEANKNNMELINSILEKARPQKNGNGCVCQGLSHREASILLACDDPAVNKRITEIAEEIKLAFYGNRIVMFAPLSFQLLRKRLRLLPLSHEEQAYCPQEAYPGGSKG